VAEATPPAPQPQPEPVQPQVAEAAPVPAPAPAPAPAQAAPAQPEVPRLVAVRVGNPEEGRYASGKAIIRSGDNLWTISRRVYGEGVRYTTIYTANQGQIRNPHLIYPGQVFDLPTYSGDAP